MSIINIEFNLPGTRVIKTENDACGNILITVEITEDHIAYRTPVMG